MVVLTRDEQKRTRQNGQTNVKEGKKEGPKTKEPYFEMENNVFHICNGNEISCVLQRILFQAFRMHDQYFKQ
jgi:hypothetical protein